MSTQNETLVALNTKVVYAGLWVRRSWFHSLDIIPHSVQVVCFSGASYLLCVLGDSCLLYCHLDPVYLYISSSVCMLYVFLYLTRPVQAETAVMHYEARIPFIC